ncbi:MAG TPA: rRNA maturation RNase YbeY [Planctomycetota bacterium]|nr:rRNA maturation RNase YbeY [Planctomycetota bacterium]
MAKASPKKKSPTFDIAIDADVLPNGVSESELSELFARAWSLSAQRPDTLMQKTLAVDVHLVDDEQISKLNQQHMKHAGPTDVLSFPLGEIDPEREAFHLGEIIVSLDTARREAAERKLPESEELNRYIVHGFLHLLGYDDDTAARRKAMFKVQEAALKG